MSHVFLIGFMGSGKSTVGRLVAERLGLPFVDIDETIERTTRRTISQLFADSGETAFRAMERRAIQEVAAGPDAVVSCGGGAVLDLWNRRTMKDAGTVVYLQVGSDEALDRIGDYASRPLLREAEDPRAAAAALLAEREPVYASAADVTVDTRHQSPDGVTAAVLAALAMHAGAGVRP
ncbi:MAG: shikimate kinase [Actinobacteria bacterium]|nr:MAG: shikimate kinase [Actinomycetota bacterium]